MIKLVLSNYSSGNKPRKNVDDDGPVVFSEIPFVHHSHGKRKAEESAIRMENLEHVHQIVVY